VFNLGRDESITIRALAERVVQTLGSRSGIRMVPYEVAFSAGFDDLQVRQPDLTRIREAIGFAPSISLEQTILDLATELKKRPTAPKIPPSPPRCTRRVRCFLAWDARRRFLLRRVGGILPIV
jgi:hypothetical protein